MQSNRMLRLVISSCVLMAVTVISHAQPARSKVQVGGGPNPLSISIGQASGFNGTGSGVSIAGINLAHGPETINVSRQVYSPASNQNYTAANAGELAIVQPLWAQLDMIAAAPPGQQRKQLESDFNDAIKNGKFTLTQKQPGDQVLAVVQDPNNGPTAPPVINAAVEKGYSNAEQSYSQFSPVGKKIINAGLYTTAATAVGNAANPKAASIASVKDPLQIEWDSIGSQHTVTCDISSQILEASTTLPGDTAVGVLDTSAAYVNDTLDLTTDQSLATPLYDVSVTISSVNGQPAVGSVSFNAYGNQVLDQNGAPIAASTMQTALTNDMQVVGGELSFMQDLPFSVVVPNGSTANSLIYTDSEAYDEASSIVPEFSPATVIGPLTLLAPLMVRRTRRKSGDVDDGLSAPSDVLC